jgi:hypothetical protein
LVNINLILIIVFDCIIHNPQLFAAFKKAHHFMKKNLKKLQLKKNTVMLLEKSDKQLLQTGQKQLSGEDCFSQPKTLCNFTRYPCLITFL